MSDSARSNYHKNSRDKQFKILQFNLKITVPNKRKAKQQQNAIKVIRWHYLVDFSEKSERINLPSTGLKTSASLRRRSLSGWLESTSPFSSSKSNTHSIGWYPIELTSCDLMSKFSLFDPISYQAQHIKPYIKFRVLTNAYTRTRIHSE